MPTTVTVHVEVEFRQRRGRKVLVAPDGDGRDPLVQQSAPRGTDELTPAVRALARAFRWRKLLEAGAVATVHEIAIAENINPSYVSRVLRLTLLAPEIIEAVMEEMSASGAETLARLMRPFPINWVRQTPFDSAVSSHDREIVLRRDRLARRRNNRLRLSTLSTTAG